MRISFCSRKLPNAHTFRATGEYKEKEEIDEEEEEQKNMKMKWEAFSVSHVRVAGISFYEIRAVLHLIRALTSRK